MERISKLEDEKKELEILIAKEEMKKPVLTKEQIVFWINRFKTGDINDESFRRQLVDCFVNSIYLYDDKIIITYNAKDAVQTIGLETIKKESEKKEGSARARIGEPKKKHLNFQVLFYFFRVRCVKASSPMRYSILLPALLQILLPGQAPMHTYFPSYGRYDTGAAFPYTT